MASASGRSEASPSDPAARGARAPRPGALALARPDAGLRAPAASAPGAPRPATPAPPGARLHRRGACARRRRPRCPISPPAAPPAHSSPEARATRARPARAFPSPGSPRAAIATSTMRRLPSVAPTSSAVRLRSGARRRRSAPRAAADRGCRARARERVKRRLRQRIQGHERERRQRRVERPPRRRAEGLRQHRRGPRVPGARHRGERERPQRRIIEHGRELLPRDARPERVEARERRHPHDWIRHPRAGRAGCARRAPARRPRAPRFQLRRGLPQRRRISASPSARSSPIAADRGPSRAPPPRACALPGPSTGSAARCAVASAPAAPSTSTAALHSPTSEVPARPRARRSATRGSGRRAPPGSPPCARASSHPQGLEHQRHRRARPATRYPRDTARLRSSGSELPTGPERFLGGGRPVGHEPPPGSIPLD